MAKPSSPPPSLSYIFSLLSISSLLLHHLPLSSSSSSSSSPPFQESSLEYWDTDEFEGLPPPPPASKIQETTPTPSSPDLTPTHDVKMKSTNDLNETKVKVKGVGDYYIEIMSILFLILFLGNYISGKKENERLALAWGVKFAAKDSVFTKNFSLLGVGEGEGREEVPLLLKEGQSTFKFYGSGRRFCQGLLATLEMKSRHDLVSRVYNAVVGVKDEITVEVFMNEDAMDQVVFGLGRRKVVKGMQKEASDLGRHGGLIASVSGRKWVADELAVVGESKEVAGDLITEAVLDQVFGDKAFEKVGQYFISMHFSDQHPSSHKKMLIFKFALPNVNRMADMTRLVALVPYYIDLIGQYKLSSHARSKTEAARQKVAQEIQKELLYARQEDLKKKKAEQRKRLEEAEAQLSVEFLHKREAKERARQMKKAMPKTKITRN